VAALAHPGGQRGVETSTANNIARHHRYGSGGRGSGGRGSQREADDRMPFCSVALQLFSHSFLMWES
jgi:hypothetical protein